MATLWGRCMACRLASRTPWFQAVCFPPSGHRSMPTTYPTPMSGWSPRTRRAGAIVVGKTNAPEFGAGANTTNAVFGPTRNPFDTDRICGGSSGGSAVALSCDMVPLATGSDTGGSLRTPAGYCGVVGLRPSPGLVPMSRRGIGYTAISVQGPMGRGRRRYRTSSFNNRRRRPGRSTGRPVDPGRFHVAARSRPEHIAGRRFGGSGFRPGGHEHSGNLPRRNRRYPGQLCHRGRINTPSQRIQRDFRGAALDGFPRQPRGALPQPPRQAGPQPDRQYGTGRQLQLRRCRARPGGTDPAVPRVRRLYGRLRYPAGADRRRAALPGRTIISDAYQRRRTAQLLSLARAGLWVNADLAPGHHNPLWS